MTQTASNTDRQVQERREESRQIREGVFFATPANLPRGRHDLAREDVLRAQRERLMIAVTELMAESGYRNVGVRDVAARARVSQPAFYHCFADKDECVFAAYDRFMDVLLTKVTEPISQGKDWNDLIRDVVHAYLATLESDPVVAQAFIVEMDALGRPARDRRNAAMGAMAAALQAERTRLWPAAPPVADSAYLGAIYAVRQLTSEALDAGHTELAANAPELSAWIGTIFNPLASASRLTGA